jgi:hypothetical protein
MKSKNEKEGNPLQNNILELVPSVGPIEQGPSESHTE